MFFAQPESLLQANQPFVSDYHGNSSSYQRQLPVILLVQTSSVHFRQESWWLICSCTAEKIISLSGSSHSSMVTHLIGMKSLDSSYRRSIQPYSVTMKSLPI